MKNKSGFTLFEVVIALAILALGLVALLHTHAVNIETCNRSKMLFVSAMLAQEKMGETEILGFARLRDERGNFGDAYPGFTWEKKVVGSPLYADARVVVVSVYRQGEPSFGTELVTLLRKGE